MLPILSTIGGFLGGIGKAVAGWWSGLDGHDKVITVLVVLLVLVGSTQGYIIYRNNQRIEQLQVQLDQQKVNERLKQLEEDLKKLDGEVAQRNANIAKIDERLGVIEKARKTPYAPKGMKADEIVKGFKDLPH